MGGLFHRLAFCRKEGRKYRKCRLSHRRAALACPGILCWSRNGGRPSIEDNSVLLRVDACWCVLMRVRADISLPSDRCRVHMPREQFCLVWQLHDPLQARLHLTRIAHWKVCAAHGSLEYQIAPYKKPMGLAVEAHVPWAVPRCVDHFKYHVANHDLLPILQLHIWVWRLLERKPKHLGLLVCRLVPRQVWR